MEKKNCIFNCFEKFWKYYDEKEEEKKVYLKNVTTKLKHSTNSINESIQDIQEWDDLFLLNTEEDFEIIEDISLKKTRKINTPTPLLREYYYTDFDTFWSNTCEKLNNSKRCLVLSFFSGFLFCLIQLIGVQLGIIVLNALFQEIVDEFRLLADNINKKEYNFYEKLEIASYKSIPEIDVGMFWSFVGIFVMKKYGFKWGNIFQILSLIGFIFLFFLFDFQLGDKLKKNYSRMELTALIISYIFLSITVGASSTIALKQFSNIYFAFYQKLCCKKESENKEESLTERKKVEVEEQKNLDKGLNQMFFYNFSVLSSLFIIIILRQIFKPFKKLNSKWILKDILIAYTSIFIINLIFYFFYSIPSINYEFKKKKLGKNEKNIDITYNNQVITNQKYYPNESESSNLKNKLGINNTQINGNNNNNKLIESKMEIKEENIDTKININESANDIKNKSQKKVCTCLGYIFFQQKIGDKEVCVFYDYDSCFKWFWLKIKQPKIIISFFIELFIQLCVVGYNSILTDRILKTYSFSKYLKFWGTFVITIIVSNITLLYMRKNTFYRLRYFNNYVDEKKRCQNCLLFCTDLSILVYSLVILSISSFISSIVYLAKDFPSGEKWENWIISEIQLFKYLDLQMLSFYDFFDDSDFLNISVVITFERFLWMIIEVFIETSKFKDKSLIIAQLAVSALFSVIMIISVVILISFLVYLIKHG